MLNDVERATKSDTAKMGRDATNADEAMTDHQAHRLKALAWQLGIPLVTGLSRAEADQRIAELERRI